MTGLVLLFIAFTSLIFAFIALAAAYHHIIGTLRIQRDINRCEQELINLQGEAVRQLQMAVFGQAYVDAEKAARTAQAGKKETIQ